MTFEAPAGKGLLFRTDARLKILILLEIVVAVFLPLKVWAPAALALALAVLSAIELGPRRSAGIFATILPVLLAMALLLPLCGRGGRPVLATAGGHVLATKEGLDGLVLVGGRFVVLTFGFSLLIRTTNQNEMVRALASFGLGFKAALTISLALRFLPTLQKTFSLISDSHSLRQSGAGKRRRMREIGPTLVSALVCSLRSIPLTAMALEIRGWGRKEKPTMYRTMPGFGQIVLPLALATAVLAAFSAVCLR